MNSLKIMLKRRVIQGWVMVAAGAFLFLLGISLPGIFPGSTMNFKWVDGFGVLFIGWGAILVARYTLAQRSPEAARRTIIEDIDERNIAIRNRAGNAAFLFNILLSSLALIVYSAITRGQPYDALWIYLAIVVIAPSAFYVISLISLHRRQ